MAVRIVRIVRVGSSRAGGEGSRIGTAGVDVVDEADGLGKRRRSRDTAR